MMMMMRDGGLVSMFQRRLCCEANGHVTVYLVNNRFYPVSFINQVAALVSAEVCTL